MPLVRFYETKSDALEALGELKQRGLRDAAAAVFDSPVSLKTLIDRGIQRKNAAAYAERIKNGQTLLIVDAPYAAATIAHEILDKPRASDRAGTISKNEGGAWDESAPLSSSFGAPALTPEHNPAALSKFFGVPVLAKPKVSPDLRGTYGKPAIGHFHATAALGPLLTKSKPIGFGFPLLAKSGPALSGGKKKVT